MTEKLAGYLRTLRQYYKDPKGHHDVLDYSRCMLLILTVILLIYAVGWLTYDWR